MIYVRQPRDDELQELKRMVRQEIGRVSQRAHMVLLSADHHPMPKIAAFSAYSRATACSWPRRFDRLGPHRSDRSVRPAVSHHLHVETQCLRLRAADSLRPAGLHLSLGPAA
jgi:hypothetical protein